MNRSAFFVGSGVLVLIVGFGLAISRSVDADRKIEDGPWTLELERPTWWPENFEGDLTTRLERIPETVPLGALDWDARVRAELLHSPWIAEVRNIRRTGMRVEFEARIVRPALSIRMPGGSALVGPRGVVLDIVPAGPSFGRETTSEWQIPEYEPVREISLVAGDHVEFAEARELLSLLRVLWRAGIYDAAVSRLPVITSTEEAGRGRVFRLRGERGITVDWGRAPDAAGQALLTSEEKIANLYEVLRKWDSISGSRIISIYRTRRATVERRQL